MPGYEMANSSTTQPTVSVVIPAYGLPDYLNEAVESVCRQTFSDYEIIVVDDGSPEEVVDRYKLPPHVLFIRHEEHFGIGARTRNTGLREAKGAYIAFLDQDDIWLPNKLEVQIAAMEARPDCGLSFSHYVIVDEDLNPMPKQNKARRAIRNPLRKLARGCFIRTPSTVILRREVLDGCGLFDESIVGSSDWEYYIRVAARYPLLVIPEALALYRMHPKQQHWNEPVMRKAKLRSLDKMLQWARAERPALVRDIRRSYSRVLRQIAHKQLANCEIEQSIATLKEAIRMWPWNPRTWGLLARAGTASLRGSAARDSVAGRR